MSLDIYLKVKHKIKKEKGSGIFIRKNGQTVEIIEEEWQRLHPGEEPVRFISPETETNNVYSGNLTHNLLEMAEKAGLAYALWTPEEKGFKYARDVILPLEAGIKFLKGAPDFYKKFNPDNGWGSYEILLQVAEEYLAACKKYPDAKIEVSR